LHILFLSDNFPPEVNAPASRTFEHCREWVKSGHRVTVITCAPNFPTGKVLSPYRNRPWQRETMAGIDVIRVWSYITANEGIVKRSLDYMSYMLGAILAAPFVRRPDIVVATSPQFFTACAGYVVSRFKRRPFVFELRDLWPESIRAVGAMGESRVLDWLERLELFLYRKADAVVAVTHAFRENLMARGIDAAKIFVVTNGADLARFAPVKKDEELVARYGFAGKFVAGYVGTHGMAHSLETVLDAAAALRDRPEGKDIRFVLLGDGAAKKDLQADAKARSLTNVIFIDTVSKDQVARYWSLLDASIIHLKKTELFTTVIPSKLFECMAMGIPVLHGVAGESADIVRRENVGIVFEPQNVQSLVDGILLLAGNTAMREAFAARAREAAMRYDRTVLAGDMLAILERVREASRR
jgi:glycosyltransferase involved in cell wall biosynthesis